MPFSEKLKLNPAGTKVLLNSMPSGKNSNITAACKILFHLLKIHFNARKKGAALITPQSSVKLMMIISLSRKKVSPVIHAENSRGQLVTRRLLVSRR